MGFVRLTKSANGWPTFWLQAEKPPLWARVLSVVYCAVIRLRYACYQMGYCRRYLAERPVLVVGNRVVGGTGKTPVILGLVALLQARGVRVGIVSRGYGRTDKTPVHLVQATDTSAQAGDEPLLLAKTLSVPVVVAKQRSLAIQTLLNHYPELDLILADDGWQHLAMMRHAVIEVIDAQKGYGNGYCLPAGPLRQPANLGQADMTLTQGKDFQLVPTHWYHLATQRYYPLNEQLNEDSPFSLIDQQDVTAMAGIGNPERFFNTLENLGINISERVALADHQAIPTARLTQSNTTIMTMKDAMRCPTDNIPPHYWALVVSTQFTPDQEHNLLKLTQRILIQ